MKPSVVLSSSELKNSSSGNFGLRPNPLLIPEIIAKFLMYFNSDDLKNFRLVNKIWNVEATHIITRKGIEIELSNKKEMIRFTTVLQNDMFIDFPSITFHVSRNFDVADKGILQFLVMHGSRIKHIKMKNLFINLVKGSRDIEKLLLLLSYFCPNLESMGLHCAHVGLSRSNRSSELVYSTEIMFTKLTSFTFENHYKYVEWKYLGDIFNCMPNLRCFEFISHHYSETLQQQSSSASNSRESSSSGDLPSSIIDILSDSYHAGNLKSLVDLIFKCIQPEIQKNEDLLKLYDMNLKLKKFESTIDSSVDLECLIKFLQQQCTTLQSLSLEMDLSSQLSKSSALQFPFMSNLSILEMHITMFTFDVLDKLPKLYKLSLYCDVNSNNVAFQVWSKIVETGKKVHTNIIALDLPLQSPTLSKLFIDKLPNLKSLKIGCTDEVLLHIYKMLPDLEELTVLTATSLTEKGFLGISRQELFPDVEFGTLTLTKDAKDEIQREISKRPFIGYLKKLRTLEIQQFAQSELTTLNILSSRFESNLSFFFGISTLSNLTTIILKTLVTKQSVMCLTRLPSLQTVYAVPVVIGRAGAGFSGRSDLPTTTNWFQGLLKEKPNLQIYVTTLPTKDESEKGRSYYCTRRLKPFDVYKGMSSCSGTDVYLDKTSDYLADASLVRKLDRNKSHSRSKGRCTIS